jgi:cell division protein FtsW (lipid II flippase)
MSALEQGDHQEERPAPLSQRQWATVVAVAVLDAAGLLVTVAAAAVLTFNDGIDRRWWWAVGLASALAVFTTALLVRITDQHRTFMKASNRLAEYLERLNREGKPVPDNLRVSAYTRQEAAQHSGHLALADQLAIALTRTE